MSRFTIALPIADRHRAATFYRETLGLELVGTPADDGLPEPLLLRLDDEVLLALVPADGLAWVLGEQPLAAPGVTECLLGVTVDTAADVDGLSDRVRGAGGSVVRAPAAQAWGYTAVCTDPDGHAWQITAAAAS